MSDYHNNKFTKVHIDVFNGSVQKSFSESERSFSSNLLEEVSKLNGRTDPRTGNRLVMQQGHALNGCIVRPNGTFAVPPTSATEPAVSLRLSIGKKGQANEGKLLTHDGKVLAGSKFIIMRKVDGPLTVTYDCDQVKVGTCINAFDYSSSKFGFKNVPFSKALVDMNMKWSPAPVGKIVYAILSHKAYQTTTPTEEGLYTVLTLNADDLSIDENAKSNTEIDIQTANRILNPFDAVGESVLPSWEGGCVVVFDKDTKTFTTVESPGYKTMHALHGEHDCVKSRFYRTLLKKALSVDYKTPDSIHNSYLYHFYDNIVLDDWKEFKKTCRVRPASETKSSLTSSFPELLQKAVMIAVHTSPTHEERREWISVYEHYMNNVYNGNDVAKWLHYLAHMARMPRVSQTTFSRANAVRGKMNVDQAHEMIRRMFGYQLEELLNDYAAAIGKK